MLRVVMMKLGQLRQAAYGRYLLATNITTYFVIGTAADSAAQYLEFVIRGGSSMLGITGINDPCQDEPFTIDHHRNRLHVQSLCVMGFVSHAYYSVVDRMLPGRSWRIVLIKLAAEVVVNIPLTLATYLCAHGLLEYMHHHHNSPNPAQIVMETRQLWPTLYQLELAYWLPWQLLNYRFVAPQYRILFENFGTLIYQNLFCLCYHWFLRNIRF